MAAAIVATTTGDVQADKTTKKKASSFAAIVDASFANWDKTKDGKLSAHEVNVLLSDPKVKGDEAMALASIHVFQRDHKNPPTFVKDDLTKLNAKASIAERRDKAQKSPHFDDHFGSFHAHLNKVTRELFVDKKPPSLDGFEQGQIGDCFFLSVLGTAISRNAEAVHRMFREDKGGAVTVTFGCGKAVNVAPLTDAEIVLGSKAGQQGLWLNVAEKAFGMVENLNPKKPRSEVALDVIASGGDPDHTIEVLTGHKAEMFAIRHTSGKNAGPPDEKKIPAIVAKLREGLKNATSRKALLACATGEGKLPPGIVSGHAYGILGFDSTHDTIHVWNPWGNNFTPKGNPGLENGYETKGGNFTLPLSDFARIFEEVYFETAMPAPRK